MIIAIRKIIIGIVLFITLTPYVSAHGITQKVYIHENERYRIELKTDPEYPVTFQKTHLDFHIFDKKTVSRLKNAQVEIQLRTIFPEKKESNDYILVFRSDPPQVFPGKETQLIFAVLDRVTRLPLPEQKVQLQVEDQKLVPSAVDGAMYTFSHTFKKNGIYSLYLTVNKKPIRLAEETWWENEFEIGVGESFMENKITSISRNLEICKKNGFAQGHFDMENNFKEAGVYEITMIINGENIPLDFTLTIDELGTEGIIDVMIITAIFLWIGQRTYRASRPVTRKS